jgi:hypothetical protein
MTSANRCHSHQSKPYTWCNGLYDWCASAAVSYCRDRHRYRYQVRSGSPHAPTGATSLVVNCAHDGNVRHHACRFAVSDLLSIGVTGVRNYLEIVYSRAFLAASAIGFKHRISDASSTTACATINACSASTAVWTLYAGERLSHQHKPGLRLHVLTC